MNRNDLRRALGSFPTGVTVISTAGDDLVHGMTANSFMSVSLEPPLVLISIANGARIRPLLDRTERFGVSILSDRQRDVCQHFAGRVQPSVIEPFRLLDNVPVLRDAAAAFVCTTRERHPVADHTLYIGEVKHYQRNSHHPLIFHLGSFNTNWWDGIST